MIKTKLVKSMTDKFMENELPQILSEIGEDKIIDTHLMTVGRNLLIIYKE